MNHHIPAVRAGATARERLVSLLAPLFVHETGKCTCGNPERFATAEDLAEDLLSQHLADMTSPDTPDTADHESFTTADHFAAYVNRRRGAPQLRAAHAGPSLTCPRCYRTSHHPEDVAYGYCGHCHDYTGPGLGALAANDAAQLRATEPPTEERP